MSPTSYPAPITPAQIAHRPLPGEGVPAGFSFSPSGRFLAFLDDVTGGLRRSLYLLDLDDPGAGPRRVEHGGEGDGAGDESVEEQLRRERARELGSGITSATWAAQADILLVPVAGRPFLLGGLPDEPSLTAIGEDLPREVVTPELSPDGSMLAFVSGGELFCAAARAGAAPRRLTSGAGEGLTNGLAEYVAQEEMGRAMGFWWSPDSSRLAYAEVDERRVHPYRILHQGSDDPHEEEVHRYPFAGGPNVSFRLGVVPAAGAAPTFMELDSDDAYLARVHWSEHCGLIAEVETRDQRRLDVVALDASSGRARVLHSEAGEPYVNLHHDFRPLAGGGWLWTSERSGFRHLEVHAPNGALERVLTSGSWQVDAVEAVDEEAGLAYFTATRDGPTECHLYSVPLAGGECRRLTGERGTHRVVVSPPGRHFVDRHAALDSPPSVSLRSLPGAETVMLVHERSDPRLTDLALEPPSHFTVTAEDGTVLHGVVFLPPGEGPFPLAVSVYGGPHAQLVTDDWAVTADLRAQSLARSGIAVLRLDNRGSARRGLAFEAAVHAHLGALEVADQAAAVAWAVRGGMADPARVAVYGWSYGGYMTLRCLELAGDVFAAGVAGAPVTDWDGYDTHYTERYMGTPAGNPGGYASSSVLARAGDISGDLLVVHGLIDENVHFRHSARLVNRLVAEGVRHRFLCFPGERHMPRKEEDRAYLEGEVLSFLREALA